MEPGSVCDDNQVRFLAKAILVIVGRDIWNPSVKMLQEKSTVVEEHIALLATSYLCFSRT